jgi:hypothetical protein
MSTTAWLTHRFRRDGSSAAGTVRLRRALEAMPATCRAWEGGGVSSSSVRVLARAWESHSEPFAEHEGILVDAARSLSVSDLRRAVRYLAQAADPVGAIEEREDLLRRRRLHVSKTIFGMVRVDGDLDPETGETFMTALAAYGNAEARSEDPEDRRTPAQVRADGLGEICRQWLDRLDRPTVAGERPHVTLTVSLEALRSGTGGLCELEHTGPVLSEVARKIMCDASVSRVVLSGASEPLDVGRRTQTVPAPMRRAVVARDRHCAFSGCDRPPSWCECHHVWHWADGGPTALHNLALLCRRHHGLIHSRRRFSVEMVGGRPVFRGPDGRVLEGRAPPSTAAA